MRKSQQGVDFSDIRLMSAFFPGLKSVKWERSDNGSCAGNDGGVSPSNKGVRKNNNAKDAGERSKKRGTGIWVLGKNDHVLEAISEKFIRGEELEPVELRLCSKRPGEAIDEEEQDYLRKAKAILWGGNKGAIAKADPELAGVAEGIEKKKRKSMTPEEKAQEAKERERRKIVARAAKAVLKHAAVASEHLE